MLQKPGRRSAIFDPGMMLLRKARSTRRETTGAGCGIGFRTASLFRMALLMWACMGGKACAQDGAGLESEVSYSARDSIRYDAREQTVYLFGAATVTYEDLQLTADRIRYSFKNEEARAFGAPDSTGAIAGKPEFSQGDQKFQADSIRYSFRTKEGYIREARTHDQESYVQARLSKRLANGEVHSRGGVLTTCDRPRPHYHFKVSRMIAIPDDKIIAGPAYMKVGRVPVPLAVPFGLFPNKPRGAAGILVPTWGEHADLGFYLLNGGYYQPFGDHMDLQLTGDVYSRGSWAARALSRYRTRYRYSGSLDLSQSTLLHSDPDFPDFSRSRTFFVRWNHVVDPKASLSDRFNASVNVGSTDNFTNNFNSSTYDYLSNTFQSNVQWTHQFHSPNVPTNLAVAARHSQNSQTRAFDITIPSLTYSVPRFFPFELMRSGPVKTDRWADRIGLTYTGTFDNRLSTTEEHLYWANIPTLAGQFQNGLRHAAALSTSFKTMFFTVNPEVRFTDRMYFEQLRKTYNEADSSIVTDTVPTFAAPYDWSAGATLTSKLYGMYQFRGTGLRAIRHVITPSFGISYRPDFSTQQEVTSADGTVVANYSPFDNGIYGKPPAGESGLLSLGLVQSLEAKVRDAKAAKDTTATMTTDPTKKLKLLDVVSLASSYDWMRDSLRWSPIGLAARTVFFNVVNLNFTSAWDPYAVDTLGRRIDQSALKVNGRLARLTSATTAIGFEVKSRKYGRSTTSEGADDGPVVGEADPDKGADVNFSIPWRLSVNYSFDAFRTWMGDEFSDEERQSVLFNGDFTVLKYWKVGFTSGYDLVAEDWTPTELNLFWDLHCWEFNANVIPFGERKSYSFRINIKASILRDLKYEQRRPIGGGGGFLL